MDGSPADRSDLSQQSGPDRSRHAGPPLWLVATAHTLLFLAGLYPVTVFGGQPYFPGPWESADTIAAFFQARPTAVRVCAFGGAGFSVPFGLLVAGATIPAAFMRLIPRWIVVLGIAIAICGELSWLYLMIPGALPLVPLTRFPGFVWLIAIGLALPSSLVKSSPTARSHTGPAR